VKYFIRIVLDKSWYKPNARQVYALTIFPRVDILHLAFSQELTPFSNKNRKKVHFEGSLCQSGVIPGQALGVNVNLLNPKRAEIKRVQVTLIQTRQVASSHQIETVFCMDLPGLTEFHGTEFHQRFELQIPATRLPPTYSFVPQCCGPALTIAFQYELQFDVKVRGFFTDFKVNVPIIVGTLTTSNEQTLTNNTLETTTASAPMYTYDEPPPSYEIAIADEKF
jgi:hypothetical protein